MPLEDNEAWIHPIKAIMVKRDKSGVPRPEGMYDSGNEPSDEYELREYQARFDLQVNPQGDARPLSAPPPVTPQTWGSVDYQSTYGIQVDVGLPDATSENRVESPLYEELYPNKLPA